LRYFGENRVDYVGGVGGGLRSLKPDFESYRSFLPEASWSLAVLVPRCGFISQFFAGQRVNEHPATGSSHCCLGPFWKEIEEKSRFVAYQASLRELGVAKIKVFEGSGERKRASSYGTQRRIAFTVRNHTIYLTVYRLFGKVRILLPAFFVSNFSRVAALIASQ
jgi:hypothetical protein